MMTPEEFRERYASERGYEDWYELWNKDRTRDLEGDIMKAYALHVLERVDKESEELSGHVTYPDGSSERYISSNNLKQIFEEIKKELKS